MSDRQELILELEGLSNEEHAELLAELKQVPDTTVTASPPTLSGPTPIEVISLVFEGIGALATIMPGVIWAVKKFQERRKKPVVGKIYLPSGEEIDIDQIDQFLKR